jgi:hypothetical protein
VKLQEQQLVGGRKLEEEHACLIDRDACSAVFFPLIMADIWETLDKSSQEYFRKDREARYGGVRLEDLQMGREVSHILLVLIAT